MKTTPPPLRVAKPCPKQWEELEGDDRKRFCSECQLHVHNLSAMSPRAQEQLIQETGGKLCIAYLERPDGDIVVPSPWDAWRRFFDRMRWASASVLALVLPGFLAGCVTRAQSIETDSKIKIGKTKAGTHQEKTVRTDSDGRMTVGMPMPPSSSR